MRAETLAVEKEWKAERKRYFQMIEKRDEVVRAGGVVRDGGLERRSLSKLNALRRKLINLMPERFHFGKINKVNGNYRVTMKRSAQKDYGLMYCTECHGGFEPIGEEIESEVHTFVSCKGHRGRRAKVYYKLKGVDFDATYHTGGLK